jgi:Protein of unknown function (DUF2281)
MEDKIKSLNEIAKKLKSEDQESLISYAKKLLQKKEKVSINKTIDLSWAGALKEYKEKYTSLDLQKKALEWWGD